MRIFESLGDWQAYVRELKQGVGFVPTMGNLHLGHASLLEKSIKENEFTLLSIFVNPTQFNNANDLANYPKTLEDDLALAREIGVDAVILPTYEQLYPDNYTYRVAESDLSQKMEGEHRPGHFDGMLTVVLKLLMLAKANNAYFGEKDYQQYELIKGMVDAFFINTNIIPCPIVREESGLAMSSRNNLMSPQDRDAARILYQILNSPDLNNHQRIIQLEEKGFAVDYLEERAHRRYVAAHFGGVRLIDNVEVACHGAD